MCDNFVLLLLYCNFFVHEIGYILFIYIHIYIYIYIYHILINGNSIVITIKNI